MTTAGSRVSKSHGSRSSVDDQLVLREIAPPDTNLAYAAMRELRTSLSSSEEFVDQVDLIQRPQGYRLVGSFTARMSMPSPSPGSGTAPA